MNFPSSFRQSLSYLLSVVWNVLLVYVLYLLCRVIYLMENWHMYAAGWPSLSIGQLLVGSLRFDTAAICYTNLLYLLLILFPLPVRQRRGWQLTAKWIYVVVNALALCLNLADTVYSQYTGRRTTSSFFREFSNEGNLMGILGIELLNHWYLVLAGLVMIAALWMLYRMPADGARTHPASGHHLGYFVIGNSAVLALVVLLLLGGIRGGFSYHRPISITTANRYVNQPVETNLVLNTPFSMIRTIGKTTFENPHYFAENEAEGIFSPVHFPTGQDDVSKPKNFVILILESFGMEYFGAYNHDLDNGSYSGYTPFLDSLIGQSMVYQWSFANGRKSIDAMPSALSSIPMFVEPYILTASALNDISGIAGELDNMGYHTAFFHGADNGSMGFLEFSQTTGFGEYYGMTEYCADTRFDGMEDFDGEWGIFDEPFLQYMSSTLSSFSQPFAAAFFSVTSHHPFPLPAKYKDVIAEGTLPIHKGIRYTDNALRQFFNTASRQPWFENTVFVLTADHTNMSCHDEYGSSLGVFRVPIIFYDPSGSLPRGWQEGIAQQIDIMPTLLGLAGYDRPYIAYGIDLLHTADSATWAVNYYNGIYQYVEGDWLLQFDGSHEVGFYRYKTDRLEHQNQMGSNPDVEQRMLLRLKAIVQSYMERMAENRLLADGD
ncbi:MAG: sulfatase-like hydrolase/transferase [Bacteroidales bacterium]|nr:sulfatase-like hydrolase/transferase [Bacteroidales bacterium]